jgi:D-psicose/D-tagatose/L-ribulose 3-epimerase
MKTSVSTWIFGPRPIEAVIETVHRLGYQGIELRGEPDLYDGAAIRNELEARGMAATSICGMYPGPSAGDLRDLAHRDAQQRRRAVEYVTRCIDLAVATGAEVVIVTPNPVAKLTPLGSVEDEWARAVEAVREAAAAAEGTGVTLAIEPINRYETYLINSVATARRFADEVASAAVGVMIDTFHANIEDPDLPSAVLAAGERLVHVHMADSNRQALGRGHLDVRGFVRVLHATGYRGALAMEPLPPIANPYVALTEGAPIDELTTYLAECLQALALAGVGPERVRSVTDEVVA